MAVNNYNKEHMKLVEKALNIYDENAPNIAGEAYFTGFRDAVYNKAENEKDPRLKEVFNEFAQLLGPNKHTINQTLDKDGNDKFETFMKDKGSLEPEELLKKITEQFGRLSKSPKSVTMFPDNKDPTDEIVNKPEGPKK